VNANRLNRVTHGHRAVPIFVPTIRMDRVRLVLICSAQHIENTNRYQLIATGFNHELLIRNQQVAGSIPAGGSRF